VLDRPGQAAVEVDEDVATRHRVAEGGPVHHELTLPEEPTAGTVFLVLVVGSGTNLETEVAAEGLVVQGKARAGERAGTRQRAGRHDEVVPVEPHRDARIDRGAVLLVGTVDAHVWMVTIPGVPVPTTEVVGFEEETAAGAVLEVQGHGNGTVAAHGKAGYFSRYQREGRLVRSIEIVQPHAFRCLTIAGQRAVEGRRIGRSAHIAHPIRRSIGMDVIETGDAHFRVALVHGLRLTRCGQRIEIQDVLPCARQCELLPVGQPAGMGELGSDRIEYGDVLEGGDAGGVAAIVHRLALPGAGEGVATFLQAVLVGAGIAKGQGVPLVGTAGTALEHLEVQLTAEVACRRQLGEQHAAVEARRSVGGRGKGEPAVAEVAVERH